MYVFLSSDECRFAEDCIRSHNLQDDQPSVLLQRNGLDPANPETIRYLNVTNQCITDISIVIVIVGITVLVNILICPQVKYNESPALGHKMPIRCEERTSLGVYCLYLESSN